MRSRPTARRARRLTRDDAGKRYAEDALAQLARAHGGALPALSMRDWPDFPVRGFMLDVSRDRVPTRDTLAHLVALLARLRFNHFQLYTEHTFAYPGHETVWRDASPITADDVRWLDRLCAEHGIELAANQNTFGHMERWLRHAPYRERAESPDGWTTPGGGRRAPSVLAPTPDNAAFALGLVRELARHFASRRVNINCDETFELGTGQSRDEVAARGRGRVYLDHLLRLIEGVHADGREALFWGDVLHHHPELVGDLPRTRHDRAALALRGARSAAARSGARGSRGLRDRAARCCAGSRARWRRSRNARSRSGSVRVRRAGTRWSAGSRTRARTCATRPTSGARTARPAIW